VNAPSTVVPYPIGIPGTPWGAPERSAWLSRQQQQRSYVADVITPLESRLPADAELFQYGVLDYTRLGLARYPLLAVRSRTWHPDRPVVVVTGGVHGYETSGPSDVDFVPDPVAWTEVPESLRVLGRQRDRWHRGLCDVLWRHRRVLFNRRYGSMGWVAFPYFVFVELLAPVVEAIGLIGGVIGLALGMINIPFAILYFLVAYGFGMVLSLATLLLEELSFQRYLGIRDRLVLITWAVLENLGYRQLTVVWRLRGIWKYLRGRTDWGAMERRGLNRAVVPPAT